MPKFSYEFLCPNCSAEGTFNIFMTQEPVTVKIVCHMCCYPIIYKPREKTSEILVVPIKKKAFLIHSSKPGEKSFLKWFRELVGLFGVNTFVIEEDPRSVDWLQKSLDGINSADFVLVFLTKRYQFTDEKGQIAGWKAPDKCYDEIAMSFARRKDILALVEKEVDPGRVLETRAWCYRFDREPKFKADPEFFKFLATYLGN